MNSKKFHINLNHHKDHHFVMLGKPLNGEGWNGEIIGILKIYKYVHCTCFINSM